MTRGRSQSGETSGFVETTPRGFRQDADNAMKGDILRGLIEAVTNSDDKYGEARSGKILIGVGPKLTDGTFEVTISDRAGGMTEAQMRERLLKAGERTSGHEHGELKRGNRGRGAKDLSAFGAVKFISVCNGVYAELRIERGGRYSGLVVRSATPSDKKSLGLNKHDGLSVVITCRGQVRRNRYDTLKKRLTNAIALRKILSGDSREVVLEYPDENCRSALKFVPPAAASTIFDEVLDLVEYGTARLALYESTEDFKDEASDLSRLGGIVISSGRACHESTLFGLEGNPYASKLFGFCDFPAIDTLARDFDDRDDRGLFQVQSNPVSIIKRDRAELEHTHPAFAALRRAVEPILNEYVKRVAQKLQEKLPISDAARRRNQSMARVLARWTAEQDEELKGGDGDIEGAELDSSLLMIPPKKHVDCGDSHTFTIRVGQRPDFISKKITAQISHLTDVGVRFDASSTEITLEERETASGPMLFGNFQVTAGDAPGQVLFEANLYSDGIRLSDSAGATLVIEEALDPAIVDPPEKLMFERDAYSFPNSKRRVVLLLAPKELVEQFGNDIRISSSSEYVIVRPSRAQFVQVAEGWYECELEVEGIQLGARARIVARIEGSLNQADATIQIKEDRGPSFKIVITSIPGNQRALWLDPSATSDGVVVQVNGSHSGAARYFGPPESGFPFQESLLARMLIAEVVADEAVRVLLRNQANREGQKMDAEAFYSRRLKLLADLLPRLHKEQLTPAELDFYNGALVSRSSHEEILTG